MRFLPPQFPFFGMMVWTVIFLWSILWIVWKLPRMLEGGYPDPDDVLPEPVARLIWLTPADKMVAMLLFKFYIAVVIASVIGLIFYVLFRLDGRFYTCYCMLFGSYCLIMCPAFHSAIGTHLWWRRLKRLNIKYFLLGACDDVESLREFRETGKLPERYVKILKEKLSGNFAPGYTWEGMCIQFSMSFISMALSIYLYKRLLGLKFGNDKAIYSAIDSLTAVTMAGAIIPPILLALWLSRRKYTNMPVAIPTRSFWVWALFGVITMGGGYLLGLWIFQHAIK